MALDTDLFASLPEALPRALSNGDAGRNGQARSADAALHVPAHARPTSDGDSGSAGSGSRLANVADFTFRLDGGLDDDLRVVRFRGRESLSELYEFVVELVSDEDWGLEATLMTGCTLALRHQGGERLVRGIVRSFERTGEGGRLTHYRAIIAPLHWQLTQRQRSRIFQQHNCPVMSVPGIIRKVFEESSIPSDCYRFAFLDDYPKREYVVQYRETDHAFLSRLMEEEGIYYFFEHDERGHRMVLANGPVAHTAPLDAADYPYRDRNGLVPEREFIYQLRDRRQVQMQAVTLDDFDFRRPSDDLAQTQPNNARALLALSDYPGNYTDREVGARLAQVRLEERQCRRQTLKLRATARGLRPGYEFNLVEHPNPALNGTLFVTRVEHRGVERQNAAAETVAADGENYQARALAIPSGVVFRPARRTPRALVRGSQTAIVVGPEHDEIHTDAYGRVKVRFHWDQAGPDETRPEQRSCWIRVSQGWAGGGYGMLFLPRVGHEVIVDFLEGDPDRPIITGRVYNNEHMPPYKLPQEKTKSTIKTNTTPDSKRYHEIRFEDRHKQEQLFIRAQRRMDTRVTGTHFHTAGGSLHELVGHVGESGQKQGAYLRTAREAVHNHNLGPQFEHIEGERYRTIDQQALDACGQDYYLLVNNVIGANAKQAVLEMQDRIVLKVDDNNYIEMTADGVRIHGTRVTINCSEPPAAGLVDKEGQPLAQIRRGKPLDALPADDGRPGRRRRGGGAPKPRQQQWDTVAIQRKPPKDDPKTVVPTNCEIKSITATCSHGRSIASPAAHPLQVVPSEGLVDELKLTTVAPACCGEHPEWSVNGQVQKQHAQGITFPALANLAYSAPLGGAWIPDAKPEVYNVSCRACEGAPQRLRVETFPSRRLDVTLTGAHFARVNRDAVQAIRDDLSYTVFSDLFDQLPLLASEARGEASARAGWREHSDHQAFYAYDIRMNLSILSVDHDPTVPLVVIPVDFPYSVKGAFDLSMDLRRSAPRDPLYSRNFTDKAPRNLGSLVFAKGVTLLSNFSIENTAAYHAEAVPLVGPNQFGFRLRIIRDYLESPTSKLRGREPIFDEIYVFQNGTVKRI